LAPAPGAVLPDPDLEPGKLNHVTLAFLPEPNEQGFRLVQDYSYVEVEAREAATDPDPFPSVRPDGSVLMDERESFALPLESLIARMGAKSQLRAWLVTNFPEHHTYVEPFGGSFKILLAKTRRSRVEIINDVDGDLVAFFQYVQSDPERLVRVINALPTHEAVVLGLRTLLAQKKLKGVERAAAFYLASQSAFNSKGDYSSYASSPFTLMNLSINRRDVLQVADRLRKVDIRSTSFSRILKTCNKPVPGSVFFYLDPPYWDTAGYKTLQGESSFGWKEQVELSEWCAAIHQMGNKFIQTNSAHEDLRKLYGKYKAGDGSPLFHIQTRDVYYSVAGKADARVAAGEFVISNFPLTSKGQMGLF
jgi:DNA adenine methylase